ncbi:hypothetical protein CKQ90_36565, partial [Klebsiella pneumoniae]
WLLAVVLFFAATLLYSQAATTKALMPAALLLGVSPGCWRWYCFSPPRCSTRRQPPPRR